MGRRGTITSSPFVAGYVSTHTYEVCSQHIHSFVCACPFLTPPFPPDAAVCLQSEQQHCGVLVTPEGGAASQQYLPADLPDRWVLRRGCFLDIKPVFVWAVLCHTSWLLLPVGCWSQKSSSVWEWPKTVLHTMHNGTQYVAKASSLDGFESENSWRSDLSMGISHGGCIELPYLEKVSLWTHSWWLHSSVLAILADIGMRFRARREI